MSDAVSVLSGFGKCRMKSTQPWPVLYNVSCALWSSHIVFYMPNWFHILNVMADSPKQVLKRSRVSFIPSEAVVSHVNCFN